MVDDKIMEMAQEMLGTSQVVTEAGMDAMKLWYTNERKEAYKAWMSARWCRLRGDKDGARKNYKKAISGYTKLRDEASKLPEDSILDIIVSIPIMPFAEPMMSAYNTGRGKRNDYVVDREFIKTQTMMDFDMSITYLNQEMSSL